MNPSHKSVQHAAGLIAQADMIVVAAGAGIGVDSGLPDFRGNEGFWNAYPALAKEQIDFQQIACPRTFVDNPARAWGFYGHRLQLYRETKPHRGFNLLRKWGENALNGYCVFTSNVDGQFQAAGFHPEQIEECHGSLHHLQCLKACTPAIWNAENFAPVVDADRCMLIGVPPTCPHCGGLARPNVLMFGDWDWAPSRQQEQSRKRERRLSQSERPVVIEIGAGSAIPSVRHFSQRVIHDHGGRLVRINPRESSVPLSKDVGIAAGAADALEAIEVALCEFLD